MKFAFALLPIAAALGFVKAGTVVTAEGLTKRDPSRVTRLFCDRDTSSCTATLDYDDGRWVARWRTSIFQDGLFKHVAEEQLISMTPVPVTTLECDSDTYTCTARMRWGDAQWRTWIYHTGLFDQEFNGAMATVPVKRLTCDGDSHKCTANLDYRDGYWVAEWDASFFHL